MKRKRLGNSLRSIKIGEAAIYEWLREDMIANAREYFNILDITKVHFVGLFHSETKEFSCAVLDHDCNAPEADIIELLHKAPITLQEKATTRPFISIFANDNYPCKRRKARVSGCPARRLYEEIRILKMSQAAIFSRLQKAIIKSGKEYFDLLTLSDVTFHFHWQSQPLILFCCVMDKRIAPFDVSLMATHMKFSTNTLFSSGLYWEMPLNEAIKENIAYEKNN